MTDLDRARRHLADDRRTHLVHVKARLSEIQRLVMDAIERVDSGRLDALNLGEIEKALRMAQRAVIDDEYAAIMQRELA